MKATEILERWERANRLVQKAKDYNQGIGKFLERQGGYEILHDGFSVCEFKEKDVGIFYTADRCYGGKYSRRQPKPNGRMEWALGNGFVYYELIHPYDDLKRWTHMELEALRGCAERNEDISAWNL